MRLKFDHPAVVTGTWESGALRRQLVRMPAEFEIAEYSMEEAPVSFSVTNGDTGNGTTTFRTLAGRQYKVWKWDSASDAFNPDSIMMDSVYWGGHFQFSGLDGFLKTERKNTAHLPYSANIEYGERKPTGHEAHRGFTSHGVACKKAPYLKKSKWLGEDTAQEVADWYEKTESIFSKIILVDGVPHVLSHEPCYRLIANRKSSPSDSGPAVVTLGDISVFGGDLDGAQFEPATGLEVLPPAALVLADQYFAADDYEGMTGFAENSGWGISNPGGQIIRVHEPEAVTKDFAELETIRHARIVYDRAKIMSGHVQHRDGVEVYGEREVERSELLHRMDSLRLAILQWQSDRNGTEHLSGPTEAVFSLMAEWETGRPRYNLFGLPEQMTAFKAREDMMEVTVIPKAWSGPRG